MTILITSVSGGWIWRVTIVNGGTFAGKAETRPDAWKEIWLVKKAYS